MVNNFTDIYLFTYFLSTSYFICLDIYTSFYLFLSILTLIVVYLPKSSSQHYNTAIWCWFNAALLLLILKLLFLLHIYLLTLSVAYLNDIHFYVIVMLLVLPWVVQYSKNIAIASFFLAFNLTCKFYGDGYWKE